MKQHFNLRLVNIGLVSGAIGWVLGGTSLIWAATPVGTAVIVKGKVSKHFGAHTIPLKEGDRVEEGSRIMTGPEGSAKILLLDNTELKIAPQSSFRVESLRSKEPPLVNVIQGNLRTKVLKDTLAKAGSNKVKFIVRTKSATMGVRGTEFDVVYNPQNKLTSVVTLEGAVAMMKNEDSANTMNELVSRFDDEKTVVVTEGTFSTTSPQTSQLTIPTKISPAQFESLKNADPTKSAQAVTQSPDAPGKYFAPIPPGVDATNFMSGGEGIEKFVKDNLGGPENAMPPTSSEGMPGLPPTPPPQGFYDPNSGAFAPPAGGFIDLKTGVYLPPPPGSAFDKNTGVFIPPPQMGGVDSQTGQFVPPAGVQLSPDGQFVPVASPDQSGPQPGITLTSGTPMPGMSTPGQMPGMLPGMPPGMPMPWMPMSPDMMPPPGTGIGGEMGQPMVPIVGGDFSCGAGCVPQGPAPGNFQPPPPPDCSTTVNFHITVN